jgi:hypothetical protein
MRVSKSVRQLAWFAAIWLASIVALAVVAYAIKLVIA